jgi:hypothetical protein
MVGRRQRTFQCLWLWGSKPVDLEGEKALLQQLSSPFRPASVSQYMQGP